MVSFSPNVYFVCVVHDKMNDRGSSLCMLCVECLPLFYTWVTCIWISIGLMVFNNWWQSTNGLCGINSCLCACTRHLHKDGPQKWRAKAVHGNNSVCSVLFVAVYIVCRWGWSSEVSGLGLQKLVYCGFWIIKESKKGVLKCSEVFLLVTWFRKALL